ncbi:MAG TPA: ectoine utilization protein EutA [Kiloniellaceae bacterium]|nr:ectoine utilization protein EutA [Kiloniellaceae bacterium]
MALPIRKIQPSRPLESRPARWRIGLIALATDHTSERDFARLSPSDEVAVYVNRVAFSNPTNAENLQAMAPRLAAAAALILPDESLDAIAYSCTAASALIGDLAVRATIEAAKPGVPVVTPTSAALAAFAKLGVSRISLLTPYSERVTASLADYFASLHLDVLNATCLGFEDDREIARIAPQSVIDAALEACHPDAEALFISCTALRALPAIDRLEAQLGRPVVSSNQAMFWQSLRRAGCDLPVAGVGRLLESY